MEFENKKSKRIGMIVSVSLHVIFLLLAIFTVSCWASKGPPYPGDEIGFEVSYGDIAGFDNMVETEHEKVEEKIEEITEPEPIEEEIIEEPIEEEIPQEVVEEENIEDSFDNDGDVSHTIEKVETKKTEKKKVEKKEKKSVYTPTKSTGKTENTTGKEGDPTSTKKAENVYTKGGGGGGNKDNGLFPSVNGWKWDAPPNAKKIKHSGEVEFTFVVTEDGEVLNIQIVRSSFTPAENEILKERLYETIFFQTSNGAPPAQTEGRLIWKIVAQ